MIVLKENSTYLYMIIPDDYKCVYNKLLKLMSNLGSSMLDNCNSSCRSSNKNLIRCWNMFQTACAAYTIGDIKKADVIIKYINLELNLGCEDIDRVDIKIIYFGDVNEEPSILEIVNGSSVDFHKKPIFTSPFYNTINYIAVPQGVIISTIENVNFGGDFLYNEFTGDDKYDRRKIYINDSEYLLWVCKFILPLNSDIRINTKEGMWEINSILYYSDSNYKPNVEDIINSNKINIDTTKIFSMSVYKKFHYIVIPDGYIIDTIENANFRGDYLYNKELNIDLYHKEYIDIDGYKYSLWYSYFPQPLNSTIEIKIKQ